MYVGALGLVVGEEGVVEVEEEEGEDEAGGDCVYEFAFAIGLFELVDAYDFPVLLHL